MNQHFMHHIVYFAHSFYDNYIAHPSLEVRRGVCPASDVQNAEPINGTPECTLIQERDATLEPLLLGIS